MSDFVDFEMPDGTVASIPVAELRARGWVRGEDLVGVAELADLFSVGKSTISGWSARRAANRMPEPVAVLAPGPVYDGHAIIGWWKSWRPRKGRRAGSLPAGV